MRVKSLDLLQRRLRHLFFPRSDAAISDDITPRTSRPEQSTSPVVIRNPDLNTPASAQSGLHIDEVVDFTESSSHNGADLPGYPDVPIDSEREIRVLTLDADEKDAVIRCSLKRQAQSGVVSPDMEYEALSYTWGLASPQVIWGARKAPTIYLEGLRYEITENLSAALSHLRGPSQPRRLWVDQLCFDQSSTDEKNHQLRHMGEIYARATKVLVWLGNVGVDFEWDPSKVYIYDKWDFTTNTDMVLACKTSMIRAVGDEEVRLFSALSLALARTKPLWRERIWVMQEFIKARDEPILLFGSERLSCDRLEAIYSRFEAGNFIRHESIISWDNVTPLVVTIQRLRQLRAAGRARNSLLSLSAAWTNTTSTEPIDKIYGMLDLLPPNERACITPDYRRSVPQVFAEATFASIKSTGFKILVHIDLCMHKPPALPSWTVDFRIFVAQKHRDSESRLLQYQSPWWQGASSNGADLRYSPSDLTLASSGRFFDKITSVFRLSYDFYHASAQPYNDTGAFIKLATSLATIDPYSPLENASDATTQAWKAQIDTILEDLHAVSSPQDWVDALAIAIAWYGALPGLSVAEGTGSRCRKPDTYKIRASLQNWTSYLDFAGLTRAIFVTESGFIGFCSGGVASGDVIALISRSEAPMVLRQVPEHDTWTFRGFAYTNGIMCNEIDIADGNEMFPEREFVLV